VLASARVVSVEGSYMEKGNKKPTAGSTGADTPASTPDDGAIEDPGAITSGGGPNVNATKPRFPRSATIKNADGTTRTVSRDQNGNKTTTYRDESGNVTKTDTIGPDSDGDGLVRTTSEPGKSDFSQKVDPNDYAESTNPDGSGTGRYTDEHGNTDITQYDTDGKATSSEWSGPDGSGSESWNPDGSGTSTETDALGNTRTDTWDEEFNGTSEYSEKDTFDGEPVSVTETYKDGVTTKSYTDSQGTSTVDTTAQDGSRTIDSTTKDGVKSSESYAAGYFDKSSPNYLGG